jgi:hypothetical protein
MLRSVDSVVEQLTNKIWRTVFTVTGSRALLRAISTRSFPESNRSVLRADRQTDRSSLWTELNSRFILINCFVQKEERGGHRTSPDRRWSCAWRRSRPTEKTAGNGLQGNVSCHKTVSGAAAGGMCLCFRQCKSARGSVRTAQKTFGPSVNAVCRDGNTTKHGGRNVRTVNAQS